MNLLAKMFVGNTELPHLTIRDLRNLRAWTALRQFALEHADPERVHRSSASLLCLSILCLVCLPAMYVGAWGFPIFDLPPFPGMARAGSLGTLFFMAFLGFTLFNATEINEAQKQHAVSLSHAALSLVDARHGMTRDSIGENDATGDDFTSLAHHVSTIDSPILFLGFIPLTRNSLKALQAIATSNLFAVAFVIRSGFGDIDGAADKVDDIFGVNTTMPAFMRGT